MKPERADLLRAASKSIWKERFTRNFQFYCPMCTTLRRIGMHPKPGQPIHFVQVALTAILVAIGIYALFPWMGAKGLVSFIPLWIGFESIYRARVRAQVRCTKCGFDPILYLVDVGKARAAIQDHWRARFAEKGIPFPEEGLENDAKHLRASSRPSAVSDRKSRMVSENLPDMDARE